MNAHALLAVKERRTVYRYVRGALEAGNIVSYLSTSPRNDLISNVSHYWTGVKNYLRSEQLSIESAYQYFPKATNRKNVVGKLHTSSSKSHSSPKNSIVVICPNALSTYINTRHRDLPPRYRTTVATVQDIIKFETYVNSAFLNSIIVCCVFNRLIRSLDIVPLLHLVRYHDVSVGSDGVITSLSDDDIICAMKRGIDAILGKGYSTIVLKTLHHIYDIEEDSLLLEPEMWCDKLEKLLGKRNSDLIRNAAAQEIRKIVMRGHNYISQWE